MNVRASHFCRSPFEHLEISPSGDVHLCSPGWVKGSVGNLGKQTLKEIWHGEKAKALRASVMNGSYQECLSTMCPHLQALDAGSQPVPYSPIESFEAPRSPHAKKIAGGETPPGPSKVNVAFDVTCNLSCPSCRKGPLGLRPGTPEWQKAEKMAGSIISALPLIRRLNIAGNGEPFASRLYWKILTSIDKALHPSLRVMLHTHALLFTPDRWKELSKAHGLIDTIEVSIDAASAETYALNRRGGSFETLLERLAFLAKLRQEGAIQRFIVSFVVQANNFREMPAFIELGRSVKADVISFGRLDDWGSFPAAILTNRSVHREDHPEHAEFVRVLSEPVFSESDVFLGNLSQFRPQHQPPKPASSRAV